MNFNFYLLPSSFQLLLVFRTRYQRYRMCTNIYTSHTLARPTRIPEVSHLRLSTITAVTPWSKNRVRNNLIFTIFLRFPAHDTRRAVAVGVGMYANLFSWSHLHRSSPTELISIFLFIYLYLMFVFLDALTYWGNGGSLRTSHSWPTLSTSGCWWWLYCFDLLCVRYHGKRTCPRTTLPLIFVSLWRINHVYFPRWFNSLPIIG